MGTKRRKKNGMKTCYSTWSTADNNYLQLFHFLRFDILIASLIILFICFSFLPCHSILLGLMRIIGVCTKRTRTECTLIKSCLFIIRSWKGFFRVRACQAHMVKYEQERNGIVPHSSMIYECKRMAHSLKMRIFWGFKLNGSLNFVLLRFCCLSLPTRPFKSQYLMVM